MPYLDEEDELSDLESPEEKPGDWWSSLTDEQALSVPQRTSGDPLHVNTPYTDQLKKLVEKRAQQSTPSFGRRLGAAAASMIPVVGPVLGQQIYDPSGADFNRQLKLAELGSKAELAELQRQGQVEDIQSKIANRRAQDETRKLTAEARHQAILQGQQNEQNRFEQQGGLIGAPDELGIQPPGLETIEPAPLSSLETPDYPANFVGPKPEVDPRLLPLRRAPQVPQQIQAPERLPQGYVAAPGAAYDPTGSRRIKMTPAEAKRQQALAQSEAQQQNWLPTPEPIKERYPNAPDKMPAQVLDTYVRLIESGQRADADRELRKWQEEQGNQLRRDIANMNAAATAANRNQKNENATRSSAFKAYSPALDSAERFNIMSKNYEDALANNDQQAMLSLLANHLGMTMGLQKGARLTKDIITEAIHSRPWLQGIAAKFDRNGYLSGVTLTPEQMRQMVSLGRERFSEDITKARNEAQYMGAEDDGPNRTANKATIGFYTRLAGGDQARANAMMAADGWSVAGQPQVPRAQTSNPNQSPTHNVGDEVTIRGKKMKITKVYPDGTFDAK